MGEHLVRLVNAAEQGHPESQGRGAPGAPGSLTQAPSAQGDSLQTPPHIHPSTQQGASGASSGDLAYLCSVFQKPSDNMGATASEWVVSAHRTRHAGCHNRLPLSLPPGCPEALRLQGPGCSSHALNAHVVFPQQHQLHPPAGTRLQGKQEGKRAWG